MASFEIIWKSSAERELRNLDRQYIQKILDLAHSLSDDPLPLHSRKLSGAKSTYRVRISDYRIIYQVDKKNNLVTIFHVRHRKDAYR
ncbi:hypothetical protein MNBD_NITROSPINAE03-972 [hydrothermal vent metagenome]|uniref:RelE/StbE replicon stabilization toxin n=1 Tax=hydrothermal vent metagenome TaxID=652676 RepID=A0A3B1C5P5_9ZZZZ